MYQIIAALKEVDVYTARETGVRENVENYFLTFHANMRGTTLQGACELGKSQ